MFKVLIIILAIIAYMFIGGIVSGFMLEADIIFECDSFFIIMVWPIMVVVLPFICSALTGKEVGGKVVKMGRKLFKYLKNMGA